MQHRLVGWLLTVILTVGSVFTPLQAPLSVAAAETAAEEQIAGDTSMEAAAESEEESPAVEAASTSEAAEELIPEDVADKPAPESEPAGLAEEGQTEKDAEEAPAVDREKPAEQAVPAEDAESGKEEKTGGKDEKPAASDEADSPSETPGKSERVSGQVDADEKEEEPEKEEAAEIIEEVAEEEESADASFAGATYNDVFATLKGSGYSLSQARASASSTFTVGQLMYVWGWLHDVNNALYKSYGSGTVNMTLAIYRPDGSCAYSYTYGNSDNNWIGVKLDRAGTWKIQSKISGALTGNNVQTVTVKAAPAPVPSNIYPTGVRINNAVGTMNVGDRRNLAAVVTPSNATNKGVTWKSSNTSVLTVNNSGRITAKQAGTAKITVTTKANGKTASIIVKVNPYESAKPLPNFSGLKAPEKMARTAESQLGYKGHNKNGIGQGDYTIYGVCVNAVGDQWCAAFISWIAKTCGCKAVPKSARCKDMADSASNYRKWTASNASKIKRGDVVFFSNSKARLGNKGHVGIVTSVSYVKSSHKYKITIVEGNTRSDKVARNTYTASESTGYIGSYWNYIGGYISVK